MANRGDPEIEPAPASPTVGERIRLARTRSKLSQGDVAHALSVTKACVSSWEVGRNDISIREITKLAAFLGVKPSAFIDSGDPAQRAGINVRTLTNAIELSERVDPTRFAALSAEGRAKVLAFIYAQERTPTPGEVRTLVSIIGDA